MYNDDTRHHDNIRISLTNVYFLSFEFILIVLKRAPQTFLSLRIERSRVQNNDFSLVYYNIYPLKFVFYY